MNVGQIKKDISSKVEIGVSNTCEKIYKVIDAYLQKFYAGYDPSYYQRTQALLHSLVKQSAGPHGSVYFEVPSYSTGTWSGETVLDVSMSGSHGGYSGAPINPVWNPAIADLEPIIALIVEELRAAGLPVH